MTAKRRSARISVAIRTLLVMGVAGALFAVPTPHALAVGAPVPDIVIDFENDTTGSVPNGFASAASNRVRFSDTAGANLYIGNFGTQGAGTRSLLVGSDFDDSGLRIVLDLPTNRLSLRIGNDDPFYTEPGDEAVLTVFRGTTRVGERRVTLNRNDAMDQTISFENGPLFNRAVLKYDVDPRVGVSEVVDQIVIGPLCTIAGTEASETLTGTSGADVICGGGGADTIYGRGGNDHISGGNGNDTLYGEGGEDFIAGNFGADTVDGGDAADRLEGGDGNDRLLGRGGNDDLRGGPGSDACDGGPGTDTATSCETRTAIP